MIARLLILENTNKIREELVKILALHLEGVKLNHPDILYFEKGVKLGVAEAKKIKEHFSLKPFSAKGRGVVLEEAGVMTVEAQNALLKTLEELPENAILLMGANSETNLLPTILSRCQIIHLQNPRSPITPTSEVGYKTEIKRLLETNIEERFNFIEKLKDKEVFLKELTSYFRKLLTDQFINKATRQNLTSEEITRLTKELLQAERWAKQNVNIRAILEYLMLVIPEQKC